VIELYFSCGVLNNSTPLNGCSVHVFQDEDATRLIESIDQVQGAARREWQLPFQGVQRGNRGLSGFPQGEARDLSPIS
jgi:hypothetical protein